jgi:hypothetical protein
MENQSNNQVEESTMEENKQTARQVTNAKYEKEKRGKLKIGVKMSLSDDVEHWDQIVVDFVKRYGSAKKAIFELHAKAKKDGEFDK